jgi:hypothetical protein
VGTVVAVLVGAAVVASLVWAAYSRLKADERDAQIPAVAAAKGLHYAKDDPFDSKVLAFSLFHQGDGSRLENVIWSEADAGAHGTQARAFDFGWYKVHHDRRGATYEEWHWSTCALAQPNGSWPPLEVQRRRMMDKALELVGGDPIHFESEEFNDTFHVTCEDRRFASALIDPQMMQFLLETKGLVGFATVGRFVLVASPQVAADEMPILLGLADEFVRRIPAAVWELYPQLAPDAPDAASIAGAGAAAAAMAADERDPDAWDPTPGVDYDLDGHPVAPETEDPWHDHPLRPHDPRPPDRIE